MEGYVFNTEGEAADALGRVNAYAGYPRENNDIINNGTPFTTSTHCEIIVHPDGGLWAIQKDGVTAAALEEMEAEDIEWWE